MCRLFNLIKKYSMTSVAVMSVLAVVQSKPCAGDITPSVSSQITIANSPENEGFYGLAAANNPPDNQMIAVWADADVSSSDVDIKGRIITGDAMNSGAIIQICVDPNIRSYGPSVCFDSANKKYLAVWTDTRNYETRIFGQFITSSGDLLGYNFAISPSSIMAAQPKVLHNPVSNSYLVLWVGFQSLYGPFNIYGQLLSSDGSLVGGVTAITNDPDYYATNVCVAYDSNRNGYLVSWSNQLTVSMHGRMLDAFGNMINDERYFGVSNGNRASLSYDPVNNRYMLTSVAEGQLINADGSLLGARFQLFENGEAATVSYDPQTCKYIAIGQSTTPVNGIIGAYIDLDGVKRNEEFTIFDVNEDPERESGSTTYDPLCATGRNGTIVMYMDVPHYTANSYDVFAKIITSESLLPYTITSTSSMGGSITPNGVIAVAHNESRSFTITPDPSFTIADVLVDGLSLGAINAYTFNNVVSNHTIYAPFTGIVPSFSINASAGPNGSISPAGLVEVDAGQSISFSITPNAGYTVADVIVDGVSIGAQNTYVFSNVTSNHTIYATFKQAIKKYTIEARAIGYGTISPSGIIEVEEGQSVTFYFSFTIEDNCFVNTLEIDGKISKYREILPIPLTAKLPQSFRFHPKPYTFKNVRSNHTITITYSRLSEIINEK